VAQVAARIGGLRKYYQIKHTNCPVLHDTAACGYHTYLKLKAGERIANDFRSRCPSLSHQDAVTWLGPSAAVPRHKHHQQIVQVARQLVVSDRSAAGNHSSSQQLGPQTDQSREEDPKPYEEWQAVGRLSFCYNRRLHSALHNCTIRSSISPTNKSPPLRAPARIKNMQMFVSSLFCSVLTNFQQHIHRNFAQNQ
jgi:hypothetical protein